MDYKTETASVRQSFADAVDESDANVGSLVMRLEELASKLCGSVPTADGPAEGGRSLRSVPDGAFERVISRCGDINQKTNRGHQAINRIEGMLS